MAKQLPQGTRDEIPEMYVLGLSIAEITRLYAREDGKPIHHSTVQLHLKKAGVARRPRKKTATQDYRSYIEQEEERKRKKRLACSHQHKIAIICMHCGEHLEETRSHPALAKVILLNHADTRQS
jgi:hypothetical protein